jgi:hydrogenase maturation factor
VSTTTAPPPANSSSASASAEPTCGSEHCITCGDDGDPMTVLAIDDQRGLALCSDDDGAHMTVETALVEPVAPGDRLLVHAGTAIVRLVLQERPA